MLDDANSFEWSRICSCTPIGMDISGINSMVNAMMMSPSFQAAMNPFLMSGNGNVLFNQLLGQSHGFNTVSYTHLTLPTIYSV